MNPVVPGATLGPFRFATYPSLKSQGREWTHLGVDLIAPSGSPVFAFGDGSVAAIVTDKDPEFVWAGNAVMVEHPAIPTGLYTIYLHLQGRPLVTVSEQVRGGIDQLGRVGRTGAAYGVDHLHFEIRRFREWLSRWGNIYAPGDQRASAYLRANWEDPVAWFGKYPKGMRGGSQTVVQMTQKASRSPETLESWKAKSAGLKCPTGAELSEIERTESGWQRRCLKKDPRTDAEIRARGGLRVGPPYLLHGPTTYFQDDGTVYHGNYVDGRPDGPQESWYSNGQRRSLSEHQNGNPHGRYILWDRKGKTVVEKEFKDGKKIGAKLNVTISGTYELQGDPETQLVLGRDLSWRSRSGMRAFTGTYRLEGDEAWLCTSQGQSMCAVYVANPGPEGELELTNISNRMYSGSGWERWRRTR